MNCTQWFLLLKNNRRALCFAQYNKARKIQKSLEYNTDPDATVIHHLRDTEEQRKYNDEHYELWGFEIDEDGNEHFEYGKYVIFVTPDEHRKIHKCSEETRKKISEVAKKNWRDDSFRQMMLNAQVSSWSQERRCKISIALKGKKFTIERCKAISERQRGRHLSEEHRRHISEGAMLAE